MFLKNLQEFINKNLFHLLSHQVMMSYYDGVGSITHYFNDFKEPLIKFLEENNFICVNNYRDNIYFIDKNIVEDYELLILEKKDYESEKIWQKYSNEKAIKYLKEKYDILNDERIIKDSVIYSLDISNNINNKKTTNVVRIFDFFTVGSEIRGDRHIENRLYTRELKTEEREYEKEYVQTLKVEDIIEEIKNKNKSNINLNELIEIYKKIEKDENIKLNSKNYF